MESGKTGTPQPSHPFHKQVILTGHVATFHTYSPELDASAHFELYSPAHYVDALVSTNDGLAVTFNVQV